MGCSGSRLSACTYETTPPFVPRFRRCRVLRCYDGDTVHVAAVVDGAPHRFSCRLAGIDTPELKTRDPYEKQEAVCARDRLAELLPQTAKVRVHGTDKYGRLLVDLYTASGESASSVLLREGLALPYDGGTKATAVDWQARRRDRLVSNLKVSVSI